MNLSPHFTLEELTLSQTAARLGLDNTPDVRVLDNLYRLAATLEEVRNAVGGPILVSSGYRSPEVNAALPGASPTSAHMDGLAADITAPGLTPKKLAQVIVDSGIYYDQLISEFSWVHLGLAHKLVTPRRELLTARLINKKVCYLPGIV